MQKLDQLIRDAHSFADQKLAESERDIYNFRLRLLAYMNAGDYKLKNKHIFIWLAFTLMLCIAF